MTESGRSALPRPSKVQPRLGALSSYEGQIFLATKILVALAIVGHVLAYATHRSLWLLILGAGGGISFFLGLYVLGSEPVIYLGFAAMLFASVADLVRRLRARNRFRVNAKSRVESAWSANRS